jgi:hypothetical protein
MINDITFGIMLGYGAIGFLGFCFLWAIAKAVLAIIDKAKNIF